MNKITKNILILTLLGSLLAANASNELQAQTEKTFSPKIKSVIVYPDRALVTRSARVKLSPGKHILEFPTAAPMLETASLRAFADNPAFIIQGISSHLERDVKTVNPELRKLEEELENVTRKRSVQIKRRNRARQDLRGIRLYYKYLQKAISGNSAFKKGGTGGAADWNKAGDFLRKRRVKAQKTVHQAEESMRLLNEKIAVIKAKLKHFRRQAVKNRRKVRLTIHVSRGSSSRVGFSYMIRGAYWRTAYGLYMRPNNTIAVEMYGEIRQLTGEDWKNVKMSLSTSRPALGAARPNLNPKSVYGVIRETQQVIVTKQEKSKDEERKPGGEGRGGSGTGKSSSFTGIEDTGSSLLFTIRKRADVKSDKRSFRVTIDQFKLKSRETYYRVVGASSHHAYLAARLQNVQPYPLPAGSADIFKKSGFIGRSRLKYTPPGSDLLVGLGVDSNIQVRRTVKNYHSTSGLLKNFRTVRSRIKLKLHNPGKTTKDLAIYERMPVSELEEIKVALTQNRTTGGYLIKKKNSGILQWKFKLKPNESKIIELHYTVTMPKNFRVNVNAK